MKIETANYTLDADDASNTVSISGSLRLNGMDEYGPILDVLRTALSHGNTMTLNLDGLEFLNSSGIAMLSKFVIEARGIENMQLTIHGSAQIPWQGKSLKNLQRLFPALELVIA
jgi:hypothetical protein